ncbi:serine hydrolase [Arthrobacter sp. PsM3]|uniref:serine hydrolase n=1 Tax=Arthrobacter sp. PsM3 TaxID=3030531 RepID=UPI00263B966D|nr:serine hydrolase [Arthrobacter sp. PsM3]MDN4643146.1 class A beta-lactamase-related serine hydrolase [Arthrobacter sp. PsM3]
MEERTPRQPRYRHPGSAGFRPRFRAFRRTRAALVALCAAALAVALSAGFYSAAQTRSTAALQAASQANSQASVTGVNGQTPAATAPATGSGNVAASAAALPAATEAPGAIDADLDAEIDSIIAANPEYQISVALLALPDGADGTGDVHEYGVPAAFVAASTAKVLAAEAYYHLVETGAAFLDDPLGAYTAEFQLQAMIQQSDNDSWSLIMDVVGHEELSEYAASMGVDYSPERNTLTPADMAHILAGLYSGTLLDPADTSQLLSYMQGTNYESLIPAAVPAGITVFHKYGLLGGELHDAGILAKDGSAYALVVYTKGADLSTVPERTEIIHQVTAAVADALF